MTMTKRLLLASAAGLLLARGASAQTMVPERIRGVIETISGDALGIKDRDGDDVTVTLAPNARVVGAKTATISDIKPGSYVGSAAVPQPDGTLKAQEVHVFPPSMVGAGEGFRPFDLTPDSTMTNGTVDGLVVTNGRTLTVKYGDGEKTIVVPDSVPVVSLELANRADVKAGAHVVVFAMRAPGGALTANAITVGLDGAVPPM